MKALQTFRQELNQSWANSKSLTAVALLMLGAFVASLAGLALDGRVVTNAPVWLKPAKFAVSTAFYAATLAWYFRYLHVWRRFVRILGSITAAVLVVEVGIIDLQAARGTTSHFNVSTPLDTSLWASMGIAIGVLWLASIGIVVVLFRQRFGDRGFGWALRLGMLITVIGAATGGLMVTPTDQQRAVIAQTHHAPTTVGSHAVGGPDGGPALPALGWSSNHGDLRIPHFLGLHALQLIPLLYCFHTRRRRSGFEMAETTYVFATSISYLALVGILTWQALRGQSLVEPDTNTAVALALWLVSSGGAILLVGRKPNACEAKMPGVLIP